MHRYTVDDIMSLDPCEGYTRERVAALWSGREALTAREIAALDIPVKDRIWALTGLATHRTARLFSCDCAERALQRVVDNGGSTDPRSWDAVITSRLYADGDRTENDLRAAAFAAYYVADSAFDSAAWPAVAAAKFTAAAARSTARYAAAAYSAACSAACSAADYAALSADWSSDYAAEQNWQLGHLVERMEADNA